jgi:hypothetical protein
MTFNERDLSRGESSLDEEEGPSPKTLSMELLKRADSHTPGAGPGSGGPTSGQAPRGLRELYGVVSRYPATDPAPRARMNSLLFT